MENYINFNSYELLKKNFNQFLVEYFGFVPKYTTHKEGNDTIVFFDLTEIIGYSMRDIVYEIKHNELDNYFKELKATIEIKGEKFCETKKPRSN